MSARELVWEEVRRGLPRLQGTEAILVLPVYETVLHDLLRLHPTPAGAHVVLQIGDDRHVQIRYGVLHANARLAAAASTGPSPVVTLELASQLVAWGLRRAPLPPFVRVAGRHVHVHVAEIPALRDAAPLWRHVERIDFDSVAGRLDVRVVISVR